MAEATRGRTDPAMTADQWRRALSTYGPDNPLWWWTDGHGPHAGAAGRLYGQTFGFSWADVDVLAALARSSRDPRLGDIASRIGALLPPRDLG